MAVEIPETRLYDFASKLEGQTVLITGISKVIGQASALTFARQGSNIAIGDVDDVSGNSILTEIIALGREAIFYKCDAYHWEDQVTLFEAAQEKFGSIDVVVINALVPEEGLLQQLDVNSDGLPMKPNLRTLQNGLYGPLYTLHLALHYLQKSTKPNSLKTIVILGSIHGFDDIDGSPLQATAHSAMFGVMASIRHMLNHYGIKITMVAPQFAGDEEMVEQRPEPSQSRILGTMIRATTYSDEDTHGGVYMIPDDQSTKLIPSSVFQLNASVHGMLRSRLATIV